MHSSLSAARWDRGHVRQATEHAARALVISRDIGWAAGEASGLGLRGFANWSMARLDSARDDFTTGLRIFRETGNRHFDGFGLVGLGLACRDLGLLHEAAVHLERAVGIDAERSRWNSSSAVQILGGVHGELGRLADGLGLLRSALASAERAGYRDSRAMMHDALAKISLELGRRDEGLEQAELALAMVGDTKRHWIQAGILGTVAAAHRELAHGDRALRAGEQALALARETRFKRAEADSLLGLSLTHRHLGRPDKARTHAEQALRLARDHSFRVVEGQALSALSAAAGSEEAHATALELGRKALAVHRETGHRPGEARTLMALARIRQKTDRAAAELMRQQAVDVFADMGVPAKEYTDLTVTGLPHGGTDVV